MPINYDEIIRKAEARRAALQAFSEAVVEFQTSMGHLAVVFAAAKEVNDAHSMLDTEAKQLLGPDLVRTTVGYAERLSELHNALDTEFSWGTYRQRISELVEKVK